MAVEFNCPTCGGTLRAGDGPAGRLVRCGGCLSTLKVPDAPPLPPEDDATTDALHTRVELLPVAHPVANTVPVVNRRRPDSSPDEDERDDEREDAPTGRGRQFWISISTLAIILGTCACCGLAAVVLPDPTWEDYESPKGGFHVELPGKPTPDMAKRVRSQPDRKHDGVEGVHLWTRAENYIIAYRDLKPEKGKPKRTDSEILDDEIKAITSDPNIVHPVNRTKACEVSGFAAREFEYEFKNGGVVTGQVIVADTRIYVLVAGGQFTSAGSDNVRQFLDSFKITDPRLQAIAERRALAKKKENKERDSD
ncbi:MAG: hypothetical protein C0467_24765 [Planctomycetaceae bacterium]|nr:hypothetical protein [Planctomycetaceae bacterium]